MGCTVLNHVHLRMHVGIIQMCDNLSHFAHTHIHDTTLHCGNVLYQMQCLNVFFLSWYLYVKAFQGISWQLSQNMPGILLGYNEP